MDDLESFSSTLQGKCVCPGKEDRLSLKAAKDGSFSVKLLYEILDGSSTSAFPFRIICSSCIPTKVGLFDWKAALGKSFNLGSTKK